jgi:hypothetical protein
MAYYDSMNKKPLSRQEHLKKDAKSWEKEERRNSKGGYGTKNAKDDRKPYVEKYGRPEKRTDAEILPR